MSERSKILHVEPNGDWRTNVAEALAKKTASGLTLIQEQTEEAGLRTIAEQGDKLAGVLTAYKNGGKEVIEAAQRAGVPRIAILTGATFLVKEAGISVTTFDKGHFDPIAVAGFFSDNEVVE